MDLDHLKKLVDASIEECETTNDTGPEYGKLTDYIEHARWPSMREKVKQVTSDLHAANSRLGIELNEKALAERRARFSESADDPRPKEWLDIEYAITNYVPVRDRDRLLAWLRAAGAAYCGRCPWRADDGTQCDFRPNHGGSHMITTVRKELSDRTRIDAELTELPHLGRCGACGVTWDVHGEEC